MIRYFLKLALRRVKRDQLLSSISIFGLTASICCSLLILLYVKHELSFDRYHPDHHNTYRMVWKLPDGVVWVPSGNWLLNRGAGDDIPEIQDIVLLDPKWGGRPHVSIGDKSLSKKAIAFFV